MVKKTWMVTGSGPDTRIMECRPTEHNQERLVSYAEARAQAVQILEDYVAPSLNRIKELKQDEFRERGKLPTLKVWESNRYLVAARTKKRAIELTQESRYGFDQSFSRVTDSESDWWYRYAAEESLWSEVRDERNRPTGEYRKLLLRVEAMAIIHEELARYEALSIARLANMVGHEERIERVCTAGLPIQVVIKVCQYAWEPSVIRVEGEIKDSVFRRCGDEIRRDIPIEKAVCNWMKEGF